jgi:cell fate regulator YaaT (PSP1 superfamily)
MRAMENAENQRLVRVRFATSPNTYIFESNELDLRPGDHVLVATESGKATARVVCREAPAAGADLSEIKPVVRKLDDRDRARLEEIHRKEREYYLFCQDCVQRRKLPMKLIMVEQAFDGSRTTFYFSSETRVDFRDLLKDLVERFRIRIELRQVGTRQETAMLGGLGACGREFCCSTYLTEFQRISVKMAKYQNMTLNPGKISGLCGKLKCCLAYEKDVYSDLITKLPKIGKRVYLKQGQGVVVSINVIEQSFVAKLEDRRFMKATAEDVLTEEQFAELGLPEVSNEPRQSRPRPQALRPSAARPVEAAPAPGEKPEGEEIGRAHV